MDRLRNEAMAAWISTFPIDTRLDAFLDLQAEAIRADLRRSVKAAYKAASRYLEEAADAGPVDLALFHPALEAHLRAGFPWIDETGLAPLRSYTGWYAWHEGYLAR